MRFAPKFIMSPVERPVIFNIKTLTGYVGGSRKVWGRIVQDANYNDFFTKVQPIGISYSFTTELGIEELQELYLKDIKKRLSEGARKRVLIKKSKNILDT